MDSQRDYAQVIAESNNDDQIVANFTYGLDLVSMAKDNESYYYLYDGLGSTKALSDSAENLTDTYDYEAFGELLNQTGSTENNYLFTGEQYDGELDNYYLRARYYDQGIGRFYQMDEWMGIDYDPITLNKYAYGYSDAVNVIDPSGNVGLVQTNIVMELQSKMMLVAVAGGGALTVFHSAFKNPNADGSMSDVQRGMITLLALSGNSVLWDLAFQDEGDGNTVARVEEVLERQVNDLKQRGYNTNISVPIPPRKKRWNTCIARAQDLRRRAGGLPIYGWGWGMSRDFNTAKKAAVRMANSSVKAVDTHHTQWRCIDSKGEIRRP